MQISSFILVCASTALTAVEAQGNPFHYFNEFGGVAGKGLGFKTTLNDGKTYYLTVFNELVLSPKAPKYGQWWFKKTNPIASFDTLWYQPDNRVITYVPSEQVFPLRRVDQLAIGHFNLAPAFRKDPPLLKFQDSAQFMACDVAEPHAKQYGYTKRLTLPSTDPPAWAEAGTCEQFTLKCIGC